MGVNSLPKTVTRQRLDYDLNPGPSAPESSTLTTRLPSHPVLERSPLNGCSSSSSSSSNSIIAEDRQTDRVLRRAMSTRAARGFAGAGLVALQTFAAERAAVSRRHATSVLTQLLAGQRGTDVTSSLW